MENEIRYHPTGTAPKYNIQTEEWGRIDIPNAHIHVRPLSWLGTCTSIKIENVTDKQAKSCIWLRSIFFLSMCDVKVFLTFTFTEYGTVLKTILPILFLYLNTVIVTAGDFEP
jgi:hypothetical protein